MNTMLVRAGLLVALVVECFAANSLLAAEEKKAVPPKIQVAILLDTSGSMEGLINQARAQLWKVVNEFAKSSRNGVRPTLEVALFEYGNDRLPASEGFIRMATPFTGDLDKVSQELFSLSTNGGSEFCGQVIDSAVRTLTWSDSPADLRCIFIAGNEPFTQGPVDYKKSCKAAADKGITVSTIHCGAALEGLQGEWESGAKLADGSFLNIDQNQKVADVPTPHDARLAELSATLNSTYVAYGSAEKRQAFVENQVAQDSNAQSAGASVAATRAGSKASALYNNSAWDLVDACRDGRVKLEEVKDEELPEEVRKLSLKERKAWVDAKCELRVKLQADIKQMTAEREKFLAADRAERAKSQPTLADSLDTAIIKATRDQAAKRNYQFAP